MIFLLASKENIHIIISFSRYYLFFKGEKNSGIKLSFKSVAINQNTNHRTKRNRVYDVHVFSSCCDSATFTL